MNENSVYLKQVNIVYEIYISPFFLQKLRREPEQKEITLSIYEYYQGSSVGGSMIPVRIGFENPMDKDFFEQFISVSGIGPRRAVKSFSMPVSKIASAIENEDVNFLKKLPGIGPQKARTIIAKLRGKLGKFALKLEKDYPHKEDRYSKTQEITEESVSILLHLGYNRKEAEKMIDNVLNRLPEIPSAEDLIQEIYKQNSPR